MGTETTGLEILAVSHHRNGTSGAPFACIIFDDSIIFDDTGSQKLGIVFDAPGHCAVLDVARLAAGDIAFGSNSWRGDFFEPALRQAVVDSQV